MLRTELWALPAHAISDNAYCTIDWAVITMTPELANLILARIETLRQIRSNEEPSLAHMAYHDYAPQWCESKRLLEEEEDETPDLDGEELRTEMDYMVISEGLVWWSMAPKHSDFYVESSALESKDLRSYLNGETGHLQATDILIIVPSAGQTEKEST